MKKLTDQEAETLLERYDNGSYNQVQLQMIRFGLETGLTDKDMEILTKCRKALRMQLVVWCFFYGMGYAEALQVADPGLSEDEALNLYQKLLQENIDAQGRNRK